MTITILFEHALRARFKGEKKKRTKFNILKWIELNLFSGKKLKKQQGIFILGRGKFDSIQVTQKSKYFCIGLN